MKTKKTTTYKKKFIPMINCGLFAGDTPMYWRGNTPFSTEEECEKWIIENLDNFSGNELGGGIFPMEIDAASIE